MSHVIFYILELEDLSAEACLSVYDMFLKFIISLVAFFEPFQFLLCPITCLHILSEDAPLT